SDTQFRSWLSNSGGSKPAQAGEAACRDSRWCPPGRGHRIDPPRPRRVAEAACRLGDVPHVLEAEAVQAVEKADSPLGSESGRSPGPGRAHRVSRVPAG